MADAAWFGAVALPVGTACTVTTWPVRICEGTWDLVLGRPTGVNNKSAGPDGFWGLHPGGSYFLFGDGSVRFIKETVNSTVLNSLSTRAGNEVLDASGF